MQEVLIVGIVFGSIVLLTAMVGGVILLGLRILRGPGGGRRLEEETRIMQELYRGLRRMEQRVEALETILLDHSRKKENAS
jgi:phage shock protein B